MDMSPLRLIFSWLFLVTGALSGVPDRANADSAYRWTDAQGQTHFSDRSPPREAADRHEFDLPSRTQTQAQGLRSGERQALQEQDRRMERLRRAADRRAATARRQLERHRNTCRQAREGRHNARTHEELKQQSAFLRRQCW